VTEPRIQYAKTSDGVSIAYCLMGEGPPLVHLPWWPLNHLQMEGQISEIRQWYERLSEGRMLVRFDGRGSGLSEREVTDFSLEARMLDLEAVVERLGLQRFDLYATLHTGPLAIAYAVRNPERVSRLVLWCSYAAASDWLLSPRVQAVRTLADMDWRTFTETATHAFIAEWETGDLAHRMAALFRESTTQQQYHKYIPIFNAVDVTDLLSLVEVPTLVLHPRQLELLGVDVARGLAARIPNARLTLLEGGGIFPYAGDIVAAAGAIDDFLDEGRDISGRESAPSSGTAIILFADIADSTALTERLGDAAFREKARDLDRTLRSIIRDDAGTAIEGKLLGDGVLAVFTSARHAIEAALACAKAGADAGLPLHLGLHAGDVIREENNVYGGAVNIASRISGLSAPGEVLLSETVRSLARTSAGVTFEDRGEQALKGVGDAVRVWVVREGEA